ncbi:MAG: hypothetical protein EZS28_020443 [Streblomastix strix]|uniref:Uncharacterized protein n=1 Tax=Streblomastix strix TaxID=222440 RepID=A0A5J4VNH3_9EUKA|nr:MAG: hypothetical protein EZS28_020443 [Streblomastix strix]
MAEQNPLQPVEGFSGQLNLTDQLDEISGSAMEGYRPVKHKIEIDITHQQKAMDSPSNTNNSTDSERNITTKNAGQALVVEVKKKLKQCHLLRIQTQTQHTPEVSNKIIDALNRLNAQGYYSVKKEVFRALFLAWWITPTLDLFATGDKNSSNHIVF